MGEFIGPYMFELLEDDRKENNFIPDYAKGIELLNKDLAVGDASGDGMTLMEAEGFIDEDEITVDDETEIGDKVFEVIYTVVNQGDAVHSYSVSAVDVDEAIEKFYEYADESNFSPNIIDARLIRG